MGLPSTDPRCFAVHQRQRSFERDEGLEAHIARELAEEAVLEWPERTRDAHARQANAYLELRESPLWEALRVDIETAGIDYRVRVRENVPYADIPATETLMRLYQGRVLERILDDPADEVLESLLEFVAVSVANRLESGVYEGKEHTHARMLRDWVECAQVNYDLHVPCDRLPEEF